LRSWPSLYFVILPDGKLFAMGGADVNAPADLPCFNSTETFDFSTKTWSAGPSMSHDVRTVLLRRAYKYVPKQTNPAAETLI
jgi:hypothetical protein